MRRSCMTIFRARSILSLVIAVAGRPDLGSSSTLTIPRLNYLIQRVTVAYEGALSANVSNMSS